MNDIRSFLAINITDEVRERLAVFQHRLRQLDPDWKWVRPEAFHITLKFLGRLHEDRLAQVWQASRETVRQMDAFSMLFKGVGVFPNPRAARVLWIGVDQGADSLRELAERVEKACEEQGFAREKRAFQAHLTLGRARRPGLKDPLAEALNQYAAEEFGAITVTHMALMKSELRRDGARYTVLDEQPLIQPIKESE